jgi:hypothetical protein
MTMLSLPGLERADKRCSTCREIKPLSEFYANRFTKDGLYHRCKPCHIAGTRKWQEKDGGTRHLENCRRYRKENPSKTREQTKSWRARNYERYRENENDWRARNSIAMYARAKARTMKQKRATPPWADRDAIAAIYREKRLLQRQTGLKWHVDHIIPLNHELVCGLHVPGNLRPILATSNLRKHDKFIPELVGG